MHPKFKCSCVTSASSLWLTERYFERIIAGRCKISQMHRVPTYWSAALLGNIALFAMCGGCAMLNADDAVLLQPAVPRNTDGLPAQPTALGSANSVYFLGPAAGLTDVKGDRPSPEAARSNQPSNTLGGLNQTTPGCTHHPVQLCAHLERRFGLLTVERVANVPVEFWRAGAWVGTANTDRQGCAILTCDAGSTEWDFTASAALANGWLTSTGAVFIWTPDQPAVVVDLDDTIMESRYLDMALWQEDPSVPKEHARATLTRLAEQYRIIYVTARARLFRSMTQGWLRQHDFPAGPIMHAEDFGAVFHQQNTKYAIVEKLRRNGIDVVAGIGDRSVDELAFDDCDLVTLIISSHYTAQRADTIVLPGWRDVATTLEQRLRERATIQQPPAP